MKSFPPDLDTFKRKLSSRLFVWAGLSVAAGTALLIGARSAFWNGLGIQALAWGVFDAAIAAVGRWLGRSGKQDAEKLKRVLWINTALDLLYITAGIVLVLTLGKKSPAAAGHGYGIIIQGSFLLLFDFFHAKAVPPSMPDLPFDGFQDDKHKPFSLAGEGDRAAVLVHGFPGTPDEMRPIADVLHKAGWSVEAVLLPGFGPEIERMFYYGLEDWTSHLTTVLRKAVGEYRTVMLLGYSFGAALSLAAAAAEQPSGLVLISPFIRLGTKLQQTAGTLLRPLLPRYVLPFKLLDPDDPAISHSLSSFFPDLDLEDPENLEKIRKLVFPLPFAAEILRAGKQALTAAGGITLPALILQGSEDDVAKPEFTRELVEAFPRNDKATAKPLYREIQGGHEIIRGDGPGWEVLTRELTAFSESLP